MNKVEKHVVNCLGKFGVYVEYRAADNPRGTILLVNGALATTNSYTQTAKHMVKDLRLNVVLFDLPYAGQSREHNPNLGLVPKDEEVGILLDLIERYAPDYLSSISWGGLATLLALGNSPKSVKKAIIGSFSPVLNAPMLDYVDRAQVLVDARDKPGCARLLNGTVGKHLPSLLKQYNYRYLTSMPDSDASQILFHMRQIREMNQEDYIQKLQNIRIPLLFVNGALDEYTTSTDVRWLAHFIKQSTFITVPDAGHFLELESRKALREVRRISREFLVGGEAAAEHAAAVPAYAVEAGLAV